MKRKSETKEENKINKPLWGNKNSNSCHFAVIPWFSLVKGERKVRVSKTAAEYFECEKSNTTPTHINPKTK